MAEAQGELDRRPTRVIARWARTHLALWIGTAAAADAALVALVAVLITLPGQSGAAISGLILVLLVLLSLSIVFPVAGHVVERRERAADLERVRRELAAEHDEARRERFDQ